jgi:hypothetical protein
VNQDTHFWSSAIPTDKDIRTIVTPIVEKLVARHLAELWVFPADSCEIHKGWAA